jgi:hypothetical protein
VGNSAVRLETYDGNIRLWATLAASTAESGIDCESDREAPTMSGLTVTDLNLEDKLKRQFASAEIKPTQNMPPTVRLPDFMLSKRSTMEYWIAGRIRTDSLCKHVKRFQS